jgi:hypothetical protein
VRMLIVRQIDLRWVSCGRIAWLAQNPQLLRIDVWSQYIYPFLRLFTGSGRFVGKQEVIRSSRVTSE